MKSKRGKSLVIVIGGIVLLGLLLFYGIARVYPKTVETKDYITTTNGEETEIIGLEEGKRISADNCCTQRRNCRF